MIDSIIEDNKNDEGFNKLDCIEFYLDTLDEIKQAVEEAITRYKEIKLPSDRSLLFNYQNTKKCLDEILSGLKIIEEDLKQIKTQSRGRY